MCGTICMGFLYGAICANIFVWNDLYGMICMGILIAVMTLDVVKGQIEGML